ncbi:MAG: hypothetical protein HC919_01375 [Oscillatoriales cyanobacterium SM2_2_1]|nr:hypothetical protein [Oscillatoriales cyanobacterium SM2_2_1]
MTPAIPSVLLELFNFWGVSAAFSDNGNRLAAAIICHPDQSPRHILWND